MATFVELTTMQGDPILVNVDHVIRMLADVDREGATLLHLSDEGRQLVREPLREVQELIKLREYARTVPAAAERSVS